MIRPAEKTYRRSPQLESWHTQRGENGHAFSAGQQTDSTAPAAFLTLNRPKGVDANEKTASRPRSGHRRGERPETRTARLG
jgi:hypothetical protein